MSQALEPVVCESCGARFPVSRFTPNERDSLHNQKEFRELIWELGMLLKAENYCRLHPETDGCIPPPFAPDLVSMDADVLRRLYARVASDSRMAVEGRALDEIERELTEFIRSRKFTLRGRMQRLTTEAAALMPFEGSVPCSRCPDGRLYVPPVDWETFLDIGTITLLNLGLAMINEDGVVTVKASWYRGTSHSTGYISISPADKDYFFWCWLVSQEQHRRIVNADDIQAIRDEWCRTTGLT